MKISLPIAAGILSLVCSCSLNNQSVSVSDTNSAKKAEPSAPQPQPEEPAAEEGATLVDQFLIGDYYSFQIPSNMDITEYATTRNATGRLSYYRTTTEHATACDGMFDMSIEAGASNGETKTFCESTPPADEKYRWLYDYKIAENHLSVGSASERLSINVFSQNYEYTEGRSRFESLCQNRSGNMSSADVMIAPNLFGSAQVAKFWMCDVSLAEDFNNIENWRVGAFFITADGQSLPDIECAEGANCSSSNPQLIEVLYMAKASGTNWTPESFARNAQQFFLSNLIELRPN